jgi:hypothetical protein
MRHATVCEPLSRLGKHDNASGKVQNKDWIYTLADEDYTDEVDVLTLQSEGRVGIGTTQPSAHLEVYSTGTANPLNKWYPRTQSRGPVG